jgi:uncharacterized protein
LGKILFFLLLGFLAWLLIRGLTKSKLKHDQDPARRGRVENMVACARCGVNLPASDAREEGGRFFCVDNPHCRP